MRRKQLEKRLKALEEFLGVICDDSDPDYIDYNFTANSYSADLRGALGELVQAAKRDKKKPT
jgi:hypothetical protein